MMGFLKLEKLKNKSKGLKMITEEKILVEDFACQETVNEHPEVSQEVANLIDEMELDGQKIFLKKDGETKAFRRVIEVNEVANYEDYRRIFKWQPTKDEYSFSVKESVMLPYISERTGLSNRALEEEIEQRRKVLHWMREQNIRSYKDVAAVIAEYYARPDEFSVKLPLGEVEALATVKHS